jgi:hypothetical protein
MCAPKRLEAHSFSSTNPFVLDGKRQEAPTQASRT